MKKKFFIVSSVCLLFFAALVVASGIYINANIEDITRKHLGAGIQFEDVEFSFSPLPAIAFSQLKIQKGKHKITIPSLVLYPDLLALLKGDVVVRKAVVEEPLILSDRTAKPATEKKKLHASAPASPPAPLTTAAIPVGLINEIMIRGGKLVMISGTENMPPLTFAVAVDNIAKKDQTLSVEVKDFTIDEIGLSFAGDVAITSFSPLGLKINASKAAINPAALKDFLVKFDFLDASVGNQIPRIEQVAAGGLQLTIDPVSGEMDLVSESLSFGQNQLQNVSVNLSKEKGYLLKCAKVLMDVGAVQGWVNENPKGKEALEQLFVKAKLKDLRASGKIELSSIDLKGGGKAGPGISGAMDLKTEGLKIHLVAENGREQNFTISQLETRVTFEEGKPSLQVSNLRLASSLGGTGLLRGTLEIPIKLKKVRFEATLDSFQVFDTAITLRAVKNSGEKLTFEVDLSGPSLTVLAKGQLQTPGREKADFWIRMTECRISRGFSGEKEGVPAHRKSNGSEAEDPARKDPPHQDFDFSAIKGRTLSGDASVKIFQYNDMPQVNDVQLTLACANNRAVVRGSMGICQVDLFVNAVLTAPNQLVAQVEGKAANMNLTSFMACFSRELPMFLSGRVSVMTSLFVQGQNTQTLLDSAQGDLMVTLKKCMVRKVSSLDYRLDFLVDMLNAAGITSLKDDAVDFRKGLAKVEIRKGRVILDRFSLSGPLLDVWGTGEFLLKKKQLRLAGQVRTALGITNDLKIDRVFQKKKT
ncbi:MAG: hypothetical protein JRD04_00875 [Deltaproteobacteria bacterium]|nr:hypothetical protein [Deltaproteobacteria bacterium]